MKTGHGSTLRQSNSLEVRQLSLRVGVRQVIEEASFDVAAGELLGIIGANGSGKSSLLKGMAGLLAPSAGDIFLEGEPLPSIPLRERARRISYLPQRPECFWPLSVERVVALGRLPFGEGEEATQAAVARMLEEVDVVPLAQRSIRELSGGEQARVFLARALVGAPQWLLVDEPGAGLDPYHQLQLMELLRSRAEKGAGVAVVLHDIGLAARFCHRLVALKEGRTAAVGPSAAVLNAEVLGVIHRVAAFQAEHEGEVVMAPWSRLP